MADDAVGPDAAAAGRIGGFASAGERQAPDHRRRPISQMLDPTFYRSPADAIAAPPERLAHVAAFDPLGKVKDAITVIDCDPSSPDYGKAIGPRRGAPCPRADKACGAESAMVTRRW